MVASAGTTVGHVKDGRLRAIAVTLSKRSPILPEVPTIAEAGMPRFSLISWAGVFGPAKMPRDVVDRLNREFNSAMTKPEVQAAMGLQAFQLTGSTPEQLGVLVKEQLESFRSTLKVAGVEPD